MRLTFKVVCVLGLAGALLGVRELRAQAQGPSAAARPPFPALAGNAAGASSISGRVVSATNSPLRNARVVLTTPELSGPRTVFTDNEGRYDAPGLPAGRYSVTASKEGYIRLSFGQTRPSQAGKPVVLGEKQSFANVNFSLPRGSVIAGIVVDQFGDPVIGAAIGVLQRTFVDGRPVATYVPGATSSLADLVITNDLGEFRYYGLEPGVFYVGAQKSTGRQGAATYGPTVYAPGTAEIGDAQRVTIGVSQTVGGVTITLTPVATASVRGVAIGADGEPIASARVTLRRRRMDVTPSSSLPATPTMSDGTFTLNEVTPGEYDVYALTGRRDRMATARISVNGRDLTGVRLEPLRLASGAGRVIVDPASRSTFTTHDVSFLLEPMDADAPPLNLSEIGRMAVTSDLALGFQTLPGRMRVSPTLPKGWVIKTVRRGGADVTDTGIDFKPGEIVDDIEIEVTDRLTNVSGLVRNTRGEAVDDYTVLLFARAPERRDGRPRHFAMARPDQNGRFTVNTLAPGSYYAIALDYVDVNEAQDPALLERLVQRATPFTLGAGESKALDLTRRD